MSGLVDSALLEETRESPCFCNIFAVTVGNSPLFSGILKDNKRNGLFCLLLHRGKFERFKSRSTEKVTTLKTTFNLEELLDHLDQFFLARNSSTNPSIRSTAAGNSTKNHVVGNHLAKMLERTIIHKPMMAKAAPEKILKVFVAIFFESLADIPDQRLQLSESIF